VADVHILRDGYVREGMNGLRVASTVALIRDDPALVIVDPGMVPAADSILEPLGLIASRRRT
jgi:hypothetical protein